AGEVYGLQNKVKTHSPLFYVHVKLDPGASLNLPVGYSERAVYVAKGTLNVSGQDYTMGQMLVFSRSEEARVRAKSAATLMILGGEPLGIRYIWWNFVSSRKDRIEQAKEDWK